MGTVARRKPDGSIEFVEEKALSRKEKREAGMPRKEPKTARTGRDASTDKTNKALAMLQMAAVPGMGLAATGIGALTGNDPRDLMQRFASGATIGLDKRVRALGNAVVDKFSGEDFTDSYGRRLGSERRQEAGVKQRSGLTGDIAEFGGALVTPVKGAGAGIKAATALNRGKQLGRAAQVLAGGAGAGLTSGALEGAARSQDFTKGKEVLTNTARGAGIGLVAGTALGGLGLPASSLGRAALRKLRPGGKMAAGREAVEAGQRSLMEGVERGGGVKRGERIIQEMTDQGSDPRLVDISPQTQQQLRAVVDKGTPGAENVPEMMLDRATQRGGRLRQKIEQVSGIDSATTSAGRQRAMRAGRLEEGGVDYGAGGVMDQPVNLSDEQLSILQDAVPTSRAAKEFKKMHAEATETIRSNPDMPDIDPNGPTTVRVLDEMLRGYKQKITRLYTAGRGNKASALRAQYDALRQTAREANPEYGDIVDKQARGLAREQAAKLGDKLSPSLFSNPRKIMDELDNPDLHPEDAEELRRALVDKVFNTTHQNVTGNINKIRLAISDPNQPEAKALWDTILGSENGTAELAKWIKAEQHGIASEARLGGSGTSGNMAGLDQVGDDAMQALANIGRAGVGAATGSPGMMANAMALAAKYGSRAGKGVDERAVNRVLLKELTRKAKPGDLTRKQLRLQKLEKARAARRVPKANKVGRAAAWPISAFTPSSLPEE